MIKSRNIISISKEDYLRKAQSYCARSEHCASEIKEKLWQWGCTDEQWRNEITESLEADRYIDAKRYCHAYVHDKVAYQCWGRVKIRLMLQEKKLPEALIEEALADIDETLYIENLKKALGKHKDDRERAIRYALQKGYEWKEIQSIVLTTGEAVDY